MLEWRLYKNNSVIWSCNYNIFCRMENILDFQFFSQCDRIFGIRRIRNLNHFHKRNLIFIIILNCLTFKQLQLWVFQYIKKCFRILNYSITKDFTHYSQHFLDIRSVTNFSKFHIKFIVRLETILERLKESMNYSMTLKISFHCFENHGIIYGLFLSFWELSWTYLLLKENSPKDWKLTLIFQWLLATEIL